MSLVASPRAARTPMRCRLAPLLLPALLLAGCTNAANQDRGGDEAAIRQAFGDFQAAIKARDGDKLWQLLADESRQDAERRAKELQAAFANGDAAKKVEMETNLKLTAGELEKIDARAYLKSNRFYGKYHEVPDSTLEKVVA